MQKQSKGVYVFLAFLLGIILVLNLLVMIVIPALIIFEIIVVIAEYITVKKIKKINEENQIERDREQNLLQNGYIKIYDGLFINETNKRINILCNDYNFSQLIDCELIENNSSVNNSFDKTKGKIKNNGKIKAKTNSFSVETQYCNEMYINIVLNDINNPNVKLNIRDDGLLIVGSKKYQDNCEKANKVLSTLKVIISRTCESNK